MTNEEQYREDMFRIGRICCATCEGSERNCHHNRDCFDHEYIYYKANEKMIEKLKIKKIEEKSW